MAQGLKEEFLRLLKEDVEFRYAVAGLIGLDEILKRLDRHEEELVKLREETARLWGEVAKLREDMVKGFERHDKILEKHSAEIAKLREDFNKMLEVIKGLQEAYLRLERRVDSLESAMISGFGELSKFAGMTFEEFVRKFLTALLRRAGEIPEVAELRRAVVEGEEINIFLEDPLIVGEATAYAESVEEIEKLLKKAEIVKAKYGREPRRFLVILTASSKVAEELRGIAGREGVELIIGKVAG